jgi:acetolactate synthase-1/2/3 large subunit
MTDSNLRPVSLKRRVADQLARLLERERIGAVFGIPGGTISPLNDALLDVPSIKTIVTRHESEAVFAAAGYAMTAGTVGVVFVTSGPGLTNALTGLAAVKCDRIPVVILAGEVPRPLQGKGALQDGSAHHLNMQNVTRSLAKAVFEVAEGKTAALRVEAALRLAKDGIPGPVVVTLPLDVLTSVVPMSASAVARAVPSFSFDEHILAGIHGRLIDEPRPLLFAGSGTRGGDAPKLLLQLAEKYRLPVVTTPKSKGVFPEGHPLSLGVFGIGGHPSALRYVSEGIGTLLAVGTGLGDLATEGFRDELRPARALIHVDMDPTVIGRHYPADIGLVAPADAFFAAMLERELTEPLVRPHRSFGVATHADPEVERTGSEGRIAPSRAMLELQRALPKNTRFIVDSGEHFLFAVQYLTLAEPDQFIALTGLGAMGSSIGLALGAKLADPARPVCVIIGDGGMTMTGLELLDAVAHKVPLVVAVINDERLGMCELGHGAVYGRVPDFTVPKLDIPTFAASIGARGYVAVRAGDIDALAPVIERAAGPLILDVRVDRSVKLPKRDRIGAMGSKSKSVA